MKNRFKKRIYASTLAISLTGTIAAASVVLSPISSVSSDGSVSNLSTSLHASTSLAAGTTTTTYLQPWNWQQDTSNLDSPIQNKAFNANGSNFALLTTKTNSYSNTSTTIGATVTQDYDSLSVYSMSTGQPVWTSDATTLSLGTATGSKFLAVSYVNSYVGRPAYYLAVVADASNNNYLVALTEGNGDLAGYVKLDNGSTVATGTTSSTKFYINVNSSSTFDIDVYGIEISTTTGTTSTSTVKLDTYSCSLANVNQAIDTTNNTLSQISTSATLNSDLMNSYFFNSSTTTGQTFNWKVATYYTDNNYVYFVFQRSQCNNANDGLNYISILRVPSSAPLSDITSNSLYSLSLTADQITNLVGADLKNPAVSVAQSGSSATIVLSDSKKQVLLYASLTPTIFDGSTQVSFNSLNSIENAFIVSISSLYNANSSSTSNDQGYVALLSTNKAVRISSDFSTVSLLYDFSNLSVTNTGKYIFNLFTIPSDANWYGQLPDGSIVQFNGSNLIGQLGTDTVNNRTENMASISLLSPDAIPSNVLFQKVSDDGSTASPTFSSFISSNANQFFTINSYDTVFGSPSFSATVNSIAADGDGNYKVSITFNQNLRKIVNGNIDAANPTSVPIASNTYTFINANSEVSVVDKSNVSADITSKLPSEVTTDDLKSVLSLKNFGNYTLTLEPNDAEGSLTVQIKSDALWVDGALQTNYVQTVSIGSADAPYFKIDVLNGLSSTVDLVTDDYLNEADNATLKTTLTNKYSTTLPSSVTAQNIIDDFLVFGDAFNSTQLIALGLVEKPTASNVQLYPMDSEGQLYVSVTIPRIGDQTDVVYSFTTATVFQKNFTTNQNVYLNFKSNDSVLNSTYTSGSGNSQTTVQFSTLTPSTLANLINNDKSLLFNFMDMSNYVYNILANLSTDASNEASLSITPSDPLGTLTLTITFDEQIAGLSPSYSCIFSGFATANTNLSGAPSVMPAFSWGTLESTALSGKKPSDITSEYLETTFPDLFNYSNGSNQLTHTLTVTPLNGSAAVLVTITFNNWWETVESNGTTTNVKLPQKSFSTVLKNGLSQSKDSINSIIWKSFSELSTDNSAYTSSTASNALSLINSSASTDLTKLELLANVSDYLKTNIQAALLSDPGALSLSIVADDSAGTLSMYATIKLDGQTYSTSSILSGFNLNGVDYSVSLAQETSDTVEALKEFIPSNLTSEQIDSLINITVGNGLQKDVQVAYDDITGSLSVTVNLYKDNAIVASTTRTYTGFKTAVVDYSGTNVIIIVAAVVVPIILLLTPILYFALFKNRRDIKKLSKVLDKRLTQQATRKRTGQVRTIEDLLNFETDKKW